jgi:hypothetical protein
LHAFDCSGFSPQFHKQTGRFTARFWSGSIASISRWPCATQRCLNAMQ